MVVLPEQECRHPDWAKERTSAGFVVCRICNPHPDQEGSSGPSILDL